MSNIHALTDQGHKPKSFEDLIKITYFTFNADDTKNTPFKRFNEVKMKDSQSISQYYLHYVRLEKDAGFPFKPTDRISHFKNSLQGPYRLAWSEQVMDGHFTFNTVEDAVSFLETLDSSPNQWRFKKYQSQWADLQSNNPVKVNNVSRGRAQTPQPYTPRQPNYRSNSSYGNDNRYSQNNRNNNSIAIIDPPITLTDHPILHINLADHLTIPTHHHHVSICLHVLTLVLRLVILLILVILILMITVSPVDLLVTNLLIVVLLLTDVTMLC